MRSICALFCFLILGFYSCIKPPNYPNEPVIEDVYFDKAEYLQNVENFTITIEFTDGDGDLGVFDTDTTLNGKLIDTRTGGPTFFKIPFIPQQGVANGISGRINVTLPVECCTPMGGLVCLPDPDHPPEELIYTVQIFDRAGNASNIMNAPAITLICD
ncbi:MAG: hypothetical protein AAF502_11580 [Bacteroidota bacterium]